MELASNPEFGCIGRRGFSWCSSGEMKAWADTYPSSSAAGEPSAPAAEASPPPPDEEAGSKGEDEEEPWTTAKERVEMEEVKN